MDYYYLVLFKDGTMMPWRTEPLKKDFAKGARFFKLQETVTILEIGEWYGQGNPAKNREFGRPTIYELIA